ncbi:ornithine racemase Orr [Paratissierella segnis]|jgi:predicted amino acid racemase|uniref:Alanine/ornithine racemase family PLP-dependent enzyme n=1 Tax=Paratissierella segnis TaxID=2763679 RepID=A0A926IJT6_9FIRM|nr:ornithine racemase Orr [Paratissierella segnis]MBC8587008.1 alanine/ornithine racemase family PLP-dependent enzyme [Paratissierella segnis]
MTYPRLIIDTKKIKHNTETLVNLAAKNGIEVAGVTKVFCANKDITKAIIDGGVKYLADSRIENIIKLKEFDLPKILLRLPMLSQADEVVEYADISLNSEVKVLEAISKSAIKQGKIHGVILMVDLGDLREGIYCGEEIFSTIDKIKDLKGIELLGIGTNLTCYGGVIPDENNIGRLVNIGKEIERRYGIKLQIISGGNSSSVYLLGSKALNGVNNLRLGESLVCGTETAYGKRIDNTYNDAFILEAEIIEAKTKPSVPTGKIGMDAFGNTPSYVDRGIRERAICAVGKQDLDDTSIIPLDEKIIILGASSDHLIVDVTDSETNYQTGDIIKFKLKYGSILKTMTSAYVDKKII